MPNGGHLFISLENIEISDKKNHEILHGKYIKIIVQDEGTGIDKKYLDQIFDPYFTTKQTGNGLGLSIVYSIIKKHNGHIFIDSKLGQGTTFTIYLPATIAGISEEESPQKIINHKDIQNAKVLIMDDEEVIQKLVKEMLRQMGFSSESASDGKEAIELYKNAMKSGELFDIVLMDLTIPGGMGGKETVCEILALNPEAKVIVSSGYASDSAMASYSNYGFKGIIGKPYTMSNLEKVIKKVLVE